MKFRYLLAMVALTATIGAYAAAMPSYTLTGDPAVQVYNPTDVVVDFTQQINSVGLNYGVLSIEFTIDTKYVDLYLNMKVGGITYAFDWLSNKTANTTCKLVGDGPASGTYAAGTLTYLAPGVFTVNLVMGPNNDYNFGDMSNAFKASASSMILAKVKGGNIYADLPDQTYQILRGSDRSNYIKTANAVNVPLDMNGGTFKVVPEPSAMAVLATGLLGLLSIKKRK